MPRYVALLRGVSPMNAKMADLRRCLEEEGFTDVRTILASGNVAFDAKATAIPALERRLEAVIAEGLGRSFPLTIRSSEYLARVLASDPFGGFTIPKDAKRIVTFFRRPPSTRPELPIERDGVQLLSLVGSELYTTYRPNPKGPVFMTMLEKTFGKDITTRTWDTVAKCARA